MLIKSIYPYLSFYFVLKCIALIIVSSNIHAATVSITNTDHPSSYSFPLSSSDKKKTYSYLLQNTSTDNRASKVIESDQNSANKTPIQDKPDTPTKNNIYNKIKKLVMNFPDENADNSLLQGSLLAFGKAKRLFNETENILNDLSQSMLLELDQYLQLELLLTKDNNAGKGFAFINQKQKYHNLDAYKQHKIDKELNVSFLRKLLRLTTLYYLLAFIIISSSFKWLITFMLFGKYK